MKSLYALMLILGMGVVLPVRTLAQPPHLFTPGRGDVVDNGRQDRRDPVVWFFDWQDVPEASEYQLYVAHIGSTYPMIDKTVSTSYYHYFSPNSYITNQNRLKWEWRVRAKVNGRWSSWSETIGFDVQPLDSDPPVP